MSDAPAAGEPEEAVPDDALGAASVDYEETQDPLLDLRSRSGEGRGGSLMLDHSIKDERPDHEEHWPMVPSREIAQFLLERIVGDTQTAQNVWNALVGPLYDLREVEARWPRGRCYCGAVHPRWRAQHPGLKSEKTRGHRMWCRYYVGPLKHGERSERTGFGSGEPMVDCFCGQRHYKWSDDDWTKREVCPEMLFVWRGPHPEEKEATIMTEPVLEPPPKREDDTEPEPSGDTLEEPDGDQGE